MSFWYVAGDRFGSYLLSSSKNKFGIIVRLLRNSSPISSTTYFYRSRDFRKGEKSPALAGFVY